MEDICNRYFSDINPKMNLTEFENLLTCPICFDYLNTCLITSCSHNYCSLCIRKYLTYRSQCPLCFEETSEPELRNNRVIDNIVRLYTNRTRSQGESCADSESKSQISTSDKPQISDDLQNHQPAIEESSEKAPCPVCNVLVKVSSINIHLDMCLNRDERMDSLRRGSSVSKRKKLPKVIYHFLSDKELKKIVTDAGLNDEGERQALIKRHKSYIVLYNSECDSLNPRPVSEILKQVQGEELIEKSLSKEGRKGLSLDRKMDPEVIEQRQKEYLKEHQSQFAQLVEDIQQRHTKNSTTASPRKTVPEKCDIDAPGTSKSQTDTIKVVTNSEEDPLPQEPENKIVIDEEYTTDAPLKIADLPSGSESESESSTKAVPSTKSKLSRKTVKESVADDGLTPQKRSRHPSDEF